MTYKIDFVDGTVLRWEATPDGIECVRDPDYHPVIYVDVRDGNQSKLETLQATLAADPKVVNTAWDRWYTSLRKTERSAVLRVEVDRSDDIRSLTREIRTLHEQGTYAPGTFELYNTDFSPQFRYCLENEIVPIAERDLTTLPIAISEKGLADRDFGQLRLADGSVTGDDKAVLETIRHRLDRHDPDILILSHGELVPLLHDRAAELGVDTFSLGRRPGYQQLAGDSRMETYGRVLHSPARYNVLGRAIINRSNSFMWAKSGLPGLLDLVERSWKPLQEAGWASIGNILTAIQIRAALDREVLIPGTKTQHEWFKTVEELHEADRGGFIFEPEVGFHTDIHELDFSSLYPNIMIEHNISPETIQCDCHPDREAVPVLGYNVCPDRGFIPEVLSPIVERRDTLKATLAEATDADTIERLESQSEALKWILVTCFGYQGYKNSKFGRIEAHEAINAHARDILLTAKAVFERNGWRIVHGIVDSIWVEAMEGAEQTPLPEVAETITDAVNIRLEYEHAYDWIGFVPKVESDSGALTKYFGKKRGEDGYKVRGIDVRQRSTPAFIATVQETMLDALDRERTPEAAIEACQQAIQRLRRGAIDPSDLVIKKRVSKPLEAYTQTTQNVAALLRYRRHEMTKQPGEDVRYVVVDDDARRPHDRVRLTFEPIDSVDVDFYTTQLIRACESIVSPFGWDRTDIRRYLRDQRDLRLTDYA